MITIFNRREVCITFDRKRLAEIRGILAQNKIDYTVKTSNRMSSSSVSGARGRMGTYGQDSSLMYEYKIYVHKENYEKAKHLAGC